MESKNIELTDEVLNLFVTAAKDAFGECIYVGNRYGHECGMDIISFEPFYDSVEPKNVLTYRFKEEDINEGNCKSIYEGKTLKEIIIESDYKYELEYSFIEPNFGSIPTLNKGEERNIDKVIIDVINIAREMGNVIYLKCKYGHPCNWTALSLESFDYVDNENEYNDIKLKESEFDDGLTNNEYVGLTLGEIIKKSNGRFAFEL